MGIHTITRKRKGSWLAAEHPSLPSIFMIFIGMLIIHNGFHYIFIYIYNVFEHTFTVFLKCYFIIYQVTGNTYFPTKLLHVVCLQLCHHNTSN